MFSKIKYLLIILCCHTIALHAQIVPKVITEPKPADPKPRPAPAPLEVTWHGDMPVKIVIGPLSKLFKPNETQTMYPPCGDDLKILVQTPASDFSCKYFFEPQNSPGYLNVFLKDNEVSYDYKTKKQIQEEKVASEKAEIERKEAEKAQAKRAEDEKARLERETADKLAAEKESQKRSLQEKIAADKLVAVYNTKMVFVDGGSFTMGCTREQEENCFSSERPEHVVNLHPFYLSKYDVTQQQWESLMGTNPSSHQDCPTCPVENVSWNMAMNFIAKLNQLSGKSYRLPTEAEWEYAARGGNKSKKFKFAGSNSIDSVGWYDGNSQHVPQPVGLKMPNELDLYDMTGNVWQWCSDWYSDDYYLHSPAENPLGPSSGEGKVARGGSWLIEAKFCHISFRSKLDPDGTLNYFGFRLASDSQ